MVVATPSALSLAACASTTTPGQSNQALLKSYESQVQAYDEAMVDVPTADRSTPHDDAPVDMSTVESINAQIVDGYHRDIERCAEQEMERLDNRWVAGQLALEFHIDEHGKVERTVVREGELRERRTPSGGELSNPGREAHLFDDCLVTAVNEWEFSPAPGTDLVHSYTVNIGEAW